MMTQRLRMTIKRKALGREKQEARAATVSLKGRQMMRRSLNHQSQKLQNQILKERRSAVGRGKRRLAERARIKILSRRKEMEVTRKMRPNWIRLRQLKKNQSMENIPKQKDQKPQSLKLKEEH